MTAFGVPLNVIVAGCPAHTVALALMVAVGNGTTVMVTDPAAGCEQLGVPALAILISVNVVVVAYVLVIEAVPEALSTMVCVPPGLDV